jgi:hypothetical protein
MGSHHRLFCVLFLFFNCFVLAPLDVESVHFTYFWGEGGDTVWLNEGYQMALKYDEPGTHQAVLNVWGTSDTINGPVGAGLTWTLSGVTIATNATTLPLGHYYLVCDLDSHSGTNLYVIPNPKVRTSLLLPPSSDSLHLLSPFAFSSPVRTSIKRNCL